MREKAGYRKYPGILKIILLTLFTGMMVFSLASCKWTIGVVRGSGDLEKQERDVSGFDQIHFSGMGRLVIEQGDEESLTIEADDNIIDLIETDVRGNELRIEFRRGFNVLPTTKIKFFLTVKDLDRIDLSGVGDIDCESFQTDKLEFNISGSGNVDLDIDADSLETRISGLGDIDLKGRVEFHDVHISGSGKYDAGDMESSECRVRVTGLGSATVNVSGELDIEISGAGNVYYKGEPEISQQITGIGRIKRLE